MSFLLVTHICFPNHRVPWRSLKKSLILLSLINCCISINFRSSSCPSCISPSKLHLTSIAIMVPFTIAWLRYSISRHNFGRILLGKLVLHYPFGLRHQLWHWHAWMVIDSKVIILNQFQPSSLPQIQIHLSEEVLKALVIIVYFTLMTNEIVPPCLKSIHNCG
jgi:hypothetical protein